jgi:hypothetical protein
METVTYWCGSSASRGEDALGNKRRGCRDEKMMRNERGKKGVGIFVRMRGRWFTGLYAE